SPGGSSGGSAVAAAAGMAAAGIGTDTGGSVRVPAALCGLVGLKVTHGRIPLTGVFPLAASLDTVGPLTRTVADAALLYQAMAGHDPADPWSVPQRLSPRRPRQDLAGMRVGVPQPWVERAPTEAPIGEGFAWALERLAGLGARVEEVHAEDLQPTDHLTTLIYGEVAGVHRAWWDEGRGYGPEVAERLEEVMRVGLDEFAAARAWRARARHAARGAFDRVNLLVTPTTGALRKSIGSGTIEIGGRPTPYRPVLSWFSALVNHLGCPAVALPIGLPGDPPSSLQLVAPWWQEELLLEVGALLERQDVVAFRPPPVW
ncbi:MAG: amidase, partial [Acidimicrobiia bacterium]